MGKGQPRQALTYLTDIDQGTGLAAQTMRSGVLRHALFIRRPCRGPIAYPFRGVKCLMPVYRLPVVARAAGVVSKADPVLFHAAPDVGSLLMAWSAKEKARRDCSQAGSCVWWRSGLPSGTGRTESIFRLNHCTQSHPVCQYSAALFNSCSFATLAFGVVHP